MSMMGVLLPNAGTEPVDHAGADCGQEFHTQPIAALAGGSDVFAGHRQPGVVTRCLDQTHGF